MYKKRSRSSQHLQLQINEEGTTPLSPPPALSSSSSSKDDVFNMLLLVILYAMQGVPLGLTLGSIPFILKAHASYTEVGFFSLASYPYSMKLIWSPIVDTVFSSKIGWRKSWILPIQMASGLLMVLFAEAANEWLEIANVKAISTLFFIFVLLAATQDIAVDGWALTLLSRKNVGHASTCQLGSITAETAGIFKLMDKGVSQETVSLVVLIEFPLEVVFAIFAGHWASKGHPFSPWLFGYFLRLGMAAIITFLVVAFPTGATFQDAPFFYFSIVLAGITTSFSSTLMFVSQGTFFARISDSSMGGTYLTLLNTMANFGFAWPKFFVFLLIDFLTFQQCVGPNPSDGDSSLYCPMKAGPAIDNPCTDAGGTCVTILDGFYTLSMAMVAVGLFIGIFCVRTLHEIEMVRIDSWRA